LSSANASAIAVQLHSRFTIEYTWRSATSARCNLAVVGGVLREDATNTAVFNTSIQRCTLCATALIAASFGAADRKISARNAVLAKTIANFEGTWWQSVCFSPRARSRRLATFKLSEKRFRGLNKL
jgi:hypothetical protein